MFGVGALVSGMAGDGAIVNKVVEGDALDSSCRGNGSTVSEVSDPLPPATGVAALLGVLLSTGADLTEVGEALARS